MSADILWGIGIGFFLTVTLIGLIGMYSSTRKHH